jgi:ParB/RepB/Spo0J family partition protein
MSKIRRGHKDIHIYGIVPGPNHRTRFDESELEELALSMKRHGLAQRIGVRPMPDGMYQLVWGERRFRAAQLLEWETIPCEVLHGLTDEAADELMMLENSARIDLDPIDQAGAFARHRDEYGKSIKEIARTAGVSTSTVQGRLDLLKLAAEIQKLVRFGHMPLKHAGVLTQLDINYQRAAMEYYQKDSRPPAFETWLELCSGLAEQQNQMAMFNLEDFMIEQARQEAERVEQRLAELGAKRAAGVEETEAIDWTRFKLVPIDAQVIDPSETPQETPGEAQESEQAGEAIEARKTAEQTAEKLERQVARLQRELAREAEKNRKLTEQLNTSRRTYAVPALP